MNKRHAFGVGLTVAAITGLVLPMVAQADNTPAPGSTWTSFGNDPGRTFYNGDERTITKDTVTQLVPKWRFPTSEPVTASPAVADVDVSGTTKKLVFDGDFAGTFFAVDERTGTPEWVDCLAALSHLPGPGNTPTPASAPAPVCDPHVPYPTQPVGDGNTDNPTDYGVIVASPAVATINGRQMVFEAANATMFGIDAATGDVVWSFVAGSSDPTYDIESSPLVVGNQVIFGIDCNQHCEKGGGVYSVDAADGHLDWFFDTAGGDPPNYVPASTDVHSYDPTDHQSPPARTCGGVWSSPSVDMGVPGGPLVYFDTANCDTASSPYFEAVVALNLADGSPAWTFTPRNLDSRDMDFGATPNAFVLAHNTHVVGAGGKDGDYYLLDATGHHRDKKTHAVTPLWRTHLTLGGSLGGFFNGATDGKTIYLSSAIGEASETLTLAEDVRRGREFALDATTGAEVWAQVVGAPDVGQNSLVPGVYFTGGLDHLVHAWDADTGALLWAYPLAGAESSTPVVAGGELFVGIGTGATYRSEFVQNTDPFGLTPAQMPTPLPLTEPAQGVWAFCVATAPGCLDHGAGG